MKLETRRVLATVEVAVDIDFVDDEPLTNPVEAVQQAVALGRFSVENLRQLLPAEADAFFSAVRVAVCPGCGVNTRYQLDGSTPLTCVGCAPARAIHFTAVAAIRTGPRLALCGAVHETLATSWELGAVTCPVCCRLEGI